MFMTTTIGPEPFRSYAGSATLGNGPRDRAALELWPSQAATRAIKAASTSCFTLLPSISARPLTHRGKLPRDLAVVEKSGKLRNADFKRRSGPSPARIME